MPVPTVRELEEICGGEGREAGAPRDFRIAYAMLVRRISIRITWLLLHTRLSANGVTLLGICIGIAGALLLAWNDFWPLVPGWSCSSSPSSRLLGRRGRALPGAGARDGDRRGRRLPRLDRPLLRTRVAIGALAYGAFTESGHDWLLLAALVAILSVVRVAVLGPRPRPARPVPRPAGPARVARVHARGARASGRRPERIDLEADYDGRRAGAAAGDACGGAGPTSARCWCSPAS